MACMAKLIDLVPIIFSGASFEGTLTSAVEVESLLNGNGSFDVVLRDRFLQLLLRSVESIDVCLVVLLVMQLHDLAANRRLKGLMETTNHMRGEEMQSETVSIDASLSLYTMHRSADLTNSHQNRREDREECACCERRSQQH
jgi:hypothetical protein